MKIHFDNVDPSARTGPNTFATRLAKSLFEAGHDVVTEGSSADVSLVFIEPTGRQLAKRVVQRLDGIWFRPQDFRTKNVRIEELYHRADAVVFQSNFDKVMTTKWFGSPKHGNVIHNGINMTRVNEVTIPELAVIRALNEKVFVCSSNWHPQKRLRDNLRLFDRVQRSQFPNSCLFVMGANPDVRVPNPHVMYMGTQPPEVYLQVFAVADWMLHVAWADHCPNVVIEALSQGTPVVCSEVGGTKELVGGFGVVLKEDPYDFELADYDNPPQLDITQIGNLPPRETLDCASIADIDINNVTGKYVKLFESLVKR